nr:Fe-S cluster assembly protein SufD [uncultured Moellerella sp.]
MAGLLSNSEKAEKRQQVDSLNQDALNRFESVFQQSLSAQSQHGVAHWEQVKKTGFPAFRHEDWHYTPLNTVLTTTYQRSQHQIDEAVCEKLSLAIDAYRLILVDGHFIPTLSSADFGPYQVSLLDNKDELPQAINGEIFLHLTESLAEQPMLINLPANKIAEKPIYLLNITSGSPSEESLATSHYRYHFKLGANSSAQVIEHYVSLDAQSRHMTGSRLTAEVGDNAQFRHIKLNFENALGQHFSHNDLTVGRDSQVQSTGFLLGSLLARYNTSVRLEGENANLSVNSLLLPKGSEIADTRTYLEHNQGHCQSKQLHKIIAMDQSKAVFNGMIKVAPHALKTDGQMTNNNLMLGSKAEIDTKPQLEIYADDVKCGHGATIGRIDNEQLFYLRSRGIDEKSAKHMIIIAFAAELTELVEEGVLKNTIMQHIHQRLDEV